MYSYQTTGVKETGYHNPPLTSATLQSSGLRIGRRIACSAFRCHDARTTQGGVYDPIDLRSYPGAGASNPELGATVTCRNLQARFPRRRGGWHTNPDHGEGPPMVTS
jgi:hypothetical protein